MTRNIGVEPLRRMARSLGELRDDVVFVGGAVVPLLVTDDAMPYVRPTKDVDIIVEATTLAEYYALRLRRRAPDAVRAVIRGALRTWLADDDFVDALPGLVLGDAASQARVPLIYERLRAVVG